VVVPVVAVQVQLTLVQRELQVQQILVVAVVLQEQVVNQVVQVVQVLLL
jgi:hypothetical protein